MEQFRPNIAMASFEGSLISSQSRKDVKCKWHVFMAFEWRCSGDTRGDEVPAQDKGLSATHNRDQINNLLINPFAKNGTDTYKYLSKSFPVSTDFDQTTSAKKSTHGDDFKKPVKSKARCNVDYEEGIEHFHSFGYGCHGIHVQNCESVQVTRAHAFDSRLTIHVAWGFRFSRLF